jgi:uncharacterized protein (DUF302 family)
VKLILILCTLLCLSFPALAAENFDGVFATRGEFQDVRDSVVMAIEGKGLKITHNNKIADMLERTGKDLGTTRQIYEFAEQFEFCSATVSRKMLEVDPHAMVLCPYIISVYKIPGDPNIYIAYRKPPRTRNPALNKALENVENLLSGIIKDAL